MGSEMCIRDRHTQHTSLYDPVYEAEYTTAARLGGFRVDTTWRTRSPIAAWGRYPALGRPRPPPPFRGAPVHSRDTAGTVSTALRLPLRHAVSSCGPSVSYLCLLQLDRSVDLPRPPAWWGVRPAASLRSSTPRAGDDWRIGSRLRELTPADPSHVTARRRGRVDASLGARRATRQREP